MIFFSHNFDKISKIFQNFKFFPKFQFFSKISIFFQNFKLFPKFQTFSKISTKFQKHLCSLKWHDKKCLCLNLKVLSGNGGSRKSDGGWPGGRGIRQMLTIADEGGSDVISEQPLNMFISQNCQQNSECPLFQKLTLSELLQRLYSRCLDSVTLGVLAIDLEWLSQGEFHKYMFNCSITSFEISKLNTF